MVPAIVFLAFNMVDGGHPRGWAIPAATDIAFALGVLCLLGPRVPLTLRVFLTALAIIDDLGAVIIITLFYTSSINAVALGGAALVLVAVIAACAYRPCGRILSLARLYGSSSFNRASMPRLPVLRSPYAFRCGAVRQTLMMRIHHCACSNTALRRG
jgi:hypothetical protein